jgi:large subunit ribosomal protein L20
MVRIKHSVASHKRKKRVLKRTKGQFGHRKNRFRQAIKSLQKGLVYAYRDRKVKKGEFKRLWIVRINAACRESGISYSRFIRGLANAKIEINRKMLADLAVNSPEAFQQLVKVAQDAGSTSQKSPARSAAKAAAKA